MTTTTTKTIRLTPKQEREFFNVAEHWGPVFCPLGYSWMQERGLLREATLGERLAHYAGLERELAEVHGKLAEAVARHDYEAAKQLASTAAWKVRRLDDRDEDDWLVTLSEAGLALRAKLREKREAAELAAKEVK